jgi:hypothetical protein
MTKQDSPSEQGKLPGMDSFGQDDLCGSPGTDKASNLIQNDKLISYVDALDYDQHASILNNLREERNAAGRKLKQESTQAMPDNVERGRDSFFNERRQRVSLSATIPTTPSHSLASGLQITMSSRNKRDLSDTRIIIKKDERGSDAITRKKTRDKVVKPLERKLSAGNLSRLLTSNDITDYDVAADALSWQSSLKNIRKFCTQYDMFSLLLIPQNVDLSSPQLVVKASHFKDAIDDWKTLVDEDYFAWQELLLRHGSKEDTTSDNWLDDVLLLSMETTLRAEVESDVFSIPKERRGSITTLRCIIKRMIIKNQEARDALENYIKSFDITKFPGENVPTACLHLKAVAHALGNNDFPSNTIRKVLDGFGKSSTKSFNEFCSSKLLSVAVASTTK